MGKSLSPQTFEEALARISWLEGLLLGLADASGTVLGLDLATIAQTRGVEMAEKLAPIQAEVASIRGRAKP